MTRAAENPNLRHISNMHDTPTYIKAENSMKIHFPKPCLILHCVISVNTLTATFSRADKGLLPSTPLFSALKTFPVSKNTFTFISAKYFLPFIFPNRNVI